MSENDQHLSRVAKRKHKIPFLDGKESDFQEENVKIKKGKINHFLNISIFVLILLIVITFVVLFFF